jgi:hypothetical protein
MAEDGEELTDEPGTVAQRITLPGDISFLSAPEWVIRYAKPAVRLFSAPQAWLIYVLSGGWVTYEVAKARVQGGESAIGILIDEYLFQTILLPAGVSLYELLLSAVGGVSTVVFGNDQQAGITDIPMIVGEIIAGPFSELFGGAVGAVTEFNATVAQSVEPLGLAAPVFVTGLWAFEVFAALWITWTLLEAIPGVDVTDIAMSLTAPLRNILRGLT